MALDIYKIEFRGATADLEGAGIDRKLLLRLTIINSRGHRPFYDWIINRVCLDRRTIFSCATKISIRSVERIASVCVQLISANDKPKSEWLPSNLAFNIYWSDGSIQELFNYPDWSGWFNEKQHAQRTHELFPERSDQENVCAAFPGIDHYVEESSIQEI